MLPANIDPEIIERFLRLRDGPLPADTESRAATIQEAATAIMTAVHPKHTKTKHKPLSKLHRALAVLLPEVEASRAMRAA